MKDDFLCAGTKMNICHKHLFYVPMLGLNAIVGNYCGASWGNEPQNGASGTRPTNL
jgi:hypothetical protein